MIPKLAPHNLEKNSDGTYKPPWKIIRLNCFCRNVRALVRRWSKGEIRRRQYDNWLQKFVRTMGERRVRVHTTSNVKWFSCMIDPMVLSCFGKNDIDTVRQVNSGCEQKSRNEWIERTWISPCLLQKHSKNSRISRTFDAPVSMSGKSGSGTTYRTAHRHWREVDCTKVVLSRQPCPVENPIVTGSRCVKKW